MTKPVPVPATVILTLKFTEIPVVETVKNDWRRFHVASEEGEFMITVRPKVWAKLEKGVTDFPHGWTCVVTGIRGVRTKRNGWKLEEPNLQVFERRVKAPVPKEQSEPAESSASTDPASQAEPKEESAGRAGQQVALEAMAG